MATFEEFLASRGPALVRTAWMLTGNREDAEDLVQTALVKCYGRYDTIQAESGKFEAYVKRAMFNANASRWRRHVPTVSSDESSLPEAVSDRTGELTTRVALLEALADLSVRQRQVVVLRFYEDLSVEESAKLMGCSVGSVKAHLHRAVATLRRTSLLTELIEERGIR